MSDIKPDPIHQQTSLGSPSLSATPPSDFSEGGSEHRKAIIANASLIAVLASAKVLEPTLLGVKVSAPVLWVFLCITHIYFFYMWRLTSTIESDTEQKLVNFKGLYRQALIAFSKDTKNFSPKNRAQLFFIRSLPIWAFLLGLIGVLYGLFVQS